MTAHSFMRAANILGWLLISAWCVWWVANCIQGSMSFVERTWIRIPAFGADFLNGLDTPTRAWMAGQDPYDYKDSVYPPIVIRLFAWIPLTTPQRALQLWSCAIVAFGVMGATAAARARKGLNLETVPISLAIASILFSTPFLFAVERANYDLLIVPFVVTSISLANRNNTNADVLAALLLAVAIWVKLYSGLLGIAVLALRKWQLAAWLAVALVLIGLIDPPQLLRFIENNQAVSEYYRSLARLMPHIDPWNHPLAVAWPSLWAGTPLGILPGWMGSMLVLGPLFCWVSWSIYRCERNEQLAVGYLFWTVALGSFVPPISNDYNLTPLPLAALAALSTRDPWSVWIGIGLLGLWWQPIALPISARVILFAKIAGLVAVGICLVRRAASHKGGDPSSEICQPSVPAGA